MISIGIDVSKNKSTVSIIKESGTVLTPTFDVAHTREEVFILIKKIKAYPDEVRVVIEYTGHYHLPLVTELVKNDIFVCCVNALRMKKYCAQSLRRVKTDKIDSFKIASYGITYWAELLPVCSKSDTYEELGMLSRQYYQYTSLVVKAKVNLSNLLDQIMPGINKILTDSKLVNFVDRYYHYLNITYMGRDKFTSDYCDWAKKQGYRINERKAKELFALAQNGIPVLKNSVTTKIMVQETVRILQEVEKSRNIILSHMLDFAKTLPEFSFVLEMNGVGETLATRLIAEIGDVHRFHSRGALIAYAGIDAPPYQSGSFTAGERHISKRGNKYLRKTGYEVMLSLIQHKPQNDAVFQFIQKKRDEGKCCKSAMIAGLNKFLRIYMARALEAYSACDLY